MIGTLIPQTVETIPMNTNDISMDLECLSVRPDAPIIAIGAVLFDRTTGKISSTFYKEIAIDSAIRSGTVSADTIRWWINQNRDAKRIFDTPDSEKPSLATALLEFTTWARGVGKGVPRVWANGPAEDVAWLRHALIHGAVGLGEPWHHTNVRDLRTIVELAEEIAGFDRTTVDAVGTSHNALDDATYQANLISACYAALRKYGAGTVVIKAGPPSKLRSTPLKAATPDDSDEL